MTATAVRPTPEGEPLRVTLRCLFAPAEVRVAADHEAGMVKLVLVAEPAVEVEVWPEVALALSLALVSRVNDLRHSGRSRP
jgi:hypothetical protein